MSLIESLFKMAAFMTLTLDNNRLGKSSKNIIYWLIENMNLLKFKIKHDSRRKYECK